MHSMLRMFSYSVSLSTHNAPPLCHPLQLLLKTGGICEQIEKSVAFTVVQSAAADAPEPTAPGSCLCYWAIRSAPVTEGVLLWTRTLLHSNVFLDSVTYGTFAPSFLSILRILAMEHPFARAEVVDLLMIFLDHNNSDAGPKQIRCIREQCLRTLMWLCTRGETAASILARIAEKLCSKTSGMDASLVRYFVGGILQVVKPPCSVLFVQLFMRVLKSQVCMDSLRSKYFEKKGSLFSLLSSFQTTLKEDNSEEATEKDAKLLTHLLSAYDSSK